MIEGERRGVYPGLKKTAAGERVMKKYIVHIAFIAAILIGVSVLLYPRVSKYINSLSQSQMVAQYFDEVAGMDGENKRAILEEAREYNKKLLEKTFRFEFTDEETAQYKNQLNTGRGVMGVIDIDKINVKLPIYHGTDDSVLQVGIGHLPGSSLPVGGVGTHAIITGHRGVPSSKLLSDLDKVEEGDIFLLYILGETLTYQVDQIKTVTPDEVRALDIDSNEDYCTLVTCTPYGINTHRLLVRGRRIENAPGTARWEEIYSGAEWQNKIITILIFMAPVTLGLTIYVIIQSRKIRKGGRIHP